MSEETDPTQSATDMLRLADAYAEAAEQLRERSCKGLSQAPFRLAAIHAIELYLTAVLLRQGHNDKALKKLRHDLKERLEQVGDLRLRRNTKQVLHALTDENEYLTARYQPKPAARRVQPNGLTAALNDVQKKAKVAVAQPAKR